MKIGLLGDTHGSQPWTEFALWSFAQRGIKTIIQVGDFGLGRKNWNNQYSKFTAAQLDHHNQTMLIVPGNHEDWDFISDISITHAREDGWVRVRGDRLLLAPRGHRWEIDEVSFVALGGAPSVDRGYRVSMNQGLRDGGKNQTWWAGEQITQYDVDITAGEGFADVFVAHDAPHGSPTIEANISGNPFGFDPVDLLYAEEGRILMTEAFRKVAPDTFIHGHYHFPVNDMIRIPDPLSLTGEPKWSNIFGLDCNNKNKSLGEYDTETKTATHIDSMVEHATWERLKYGGR